MNQSGSLRMALIFDLWLTRVAHEPNTVRYLPHDDGATGGGSISDTRGAGRPTEGLDNDGPHHVRQSRNRGAAHWATVANPCGCNQEVR